MIEETWSIDELLDMVELDDLEGLGQAKRLTARICATIHNAAAQTRWSSLVAQLGKSAPPPPPMLDEADWLPRKASGKVAVRVVEPTAADGQSQLLTRAESVSKKVCSAFAEMFGMG